MATVGGQVLPDDEDQQKKEMLSEALAPTVQAGAGAAPRAAERKGAKFANIQSYLQANQGAGEAMAEKIAKPVSTQAGQVQSALQSEAPAASAAIYSGQFTPEKRQELQSAIQSGDLSRLSNISRYLGGGYAGPGSVGFSGTEAAAAGLGEKAAALKTAGGISESIKGAYGGGGGLLDVALASRYGGGQLSEAAQAGERLAGSAEKEIEAAGQRISGSQAAGAEQSRQLGEFARAQEGVWGEKAKGFAKGSKERAQYEALAKLMGWTPQAQVAGVGGIPTGPAVRRDVNIHTGTGPTGPKSAPAVQKAAVPGAGPRNRAPGWQEKPAEFSTTGQLPSDITMIGEPTDATKKKKKGALSRIGQFLGNTVQDLGKNPVNVRPLY